ncbi:DUF4265 domain-containing protein [Microbulbifer epialgicus]|uniref:DUF4265 domain-containing protein n=1 Tax=Microbulbifer epialgicus TaxID=393907 RepID=A0ABV4P6S7_9GAMM
MRLLLLIILSAALTGCLEVEANSARSAEEEEILTFVKVLEPSGHKLVRIIFDNSADEDSKEKEQLDDLVAMGCTYEGANPKYYCLDIPPRN